MACNFASSACSHKADRPDIFPRIFDQAGFLERPVRLGKDGLSQLFNARIDRAYNWHSCNNRFGVANHRAPNKSLCKRTNKDRKQQKQHDPNATYVDLGFRTEQVFKELFRLIGARHKRQHNPIYPTDDRPNQPDSQGHWCDYHEPGQKT